VKDVMTKSRTTCVKLFLCTGAVGLQVLNKERFVGLALSQKYIRVN
jgi:hypothetical protein